MGEEGLRDAFSAYLGLAIANGGRALALSTKPEDLAAFVADFDLIMAVYPDPASPVGVRFLPIKGYDTWSAVAAGKITQDIRSNAIPCPDRKAALDLLARFGDPAWAEEIEASKPTGFH